MQIYTYVVASYRFIPMLMVVAILIPNKQVAIQFLRAYNFNSGGTNKSYQFIPMLMVVAILIPNKQVAIQFQTILACNFNSGGTNKSY